ncbi:hypothetical protein BJX76DRAFT_159749 [Aspergillus varians]
MYTLPDLSHSLLAHAGDAHREITFILVSLKEDGDVKRVVYQFYLRHGGAMMIMRRGLSTLPLLDSQEFPSPIHVLANNRKRGYFECSESSERKEKPEMKEKKMDVGDRRCQRCSAWVLSSGPKQLIDSAIDLFRGATIKHPADLARPPAPVRSKSLHCPPAARVDSSTSPQPFHSPSASGALLHLQVP